MFNKTILIAVLLGLSQSSFATSKKDSANSTKKTVDCSIDVNSPDCKQAYAPAEEDPMDYELDTEEDSLPSYDDELDG